MHRGPMVPVVVITAIAALIGCGSRADAGPAPTATVTTTVTETTAVFRLSDGNQYRWSLT